jgi:peptidoglycan/xylan/chitin deacetylase (PgdA/CDA1 family)
MSPLVYVTTSWDDGHPTDLRIADLLARHGIAGTFYVPRQTQIATMSPTEIRQIAGSFEIGAHTLHHVELTQVSDEVAWKEIGESKAWVEDVAGVGCESFCPPLGRFETRHLRMVRRAGYRGLRTVEFLSLALPRRKHGVLVMPTTVQAYPHRFAALALNALKRKNVGNLWRYVLHGHRAEWHVMAESLLGHVQSWGGVFHLWGHSWELRDSDQWQRLGDVLRLMRDLRGPAIALTNGQIYRATPLEAAP